MTINLCYLPFSSNFVSQEDLQNLVAEYSAETRLADLQLSEA
jgi:hypothetical protein